MWSIIKVICCYTSIDDVKSHIPYFDVFVWRSWSMPEEVSNITTQSILNYVVDLYGILIGKAPRFLLVYWVQYKSTFGISRCLIWYFYYTIKWRCISICSLNDDVHVVTCLCGFRISWQWSIFVNSYECNVLILIPQCSDNTFEDVKSWFWIEI